MLQVVGRRGIFDKIHEMGGFQEFSNLERKTNAAMSWGAANFQDLVLLICFKDDFQKWDGLTPHGLLNGLARNSKK
jgi:hypothetical protein